MKQSNHDPTLTTIDEGTQESIDKQLSAYYQDERRRLPTEPSFDQMWRQAQDTAIFSKNKRMITNTWGWKAGLIVAALVCIHMVRTNLPILQDTPHPSILSIERLDNEPIWEDGWLEDDEWSTEWTLSDTYQEGTDKKGSNTGHRGG